MFGWMTNRKGRSRCVCEGVCGFEIGNVHSQRAEEIERDSQKQVSRAATNMAAMTLCAYELQRLETIRQNALIMEAMGITEAAKGLREPVKKPKAKQPREPKPLPTAKRSSRRLSGDAAALIGLDDGDEETIEPYRDPNDVSQMLPAELKRWCEELREDALKAPWVEQLGEEQRQRLHAAQVWLAPFTEFTARFGGNKETTMSRQNVKSVLKRVFQLVSGAGVTTPLREGAFAAGRPITLGVSCEAVDALRVEAQLWCPLRTAPEDLVGRVHEGAVIERKPASRCLDTSNGWLLNHPLVKVRKYCEHLDEVREKGLERTMHRLMTGADEPSDPSVRPSEADGENEARTHRQDSLSDFIVADGEADGEAERPAKPAGKKYRPPPQQSRGASAPTSVDAARAADDDDDDGDENAPLVKRPKQARSAQASGAPPPPAPFGEGELVEARRRPSGQAEDVATVAWCSARIDNVNEDTGTYDLCYDDGQYEEDVAPVCIRRR